MKASEILRGRILKGKSMQRVGKVFYTSPPVQGKCIFILFLQERLKSYSLSIFPQQVLNAFLKAWTAAVKDTFTLITDHLLGCPRQLGRTTLQLQQGPNWAAITKSLTMSRLKEHYKVRRCCSFEKSSSSWCFLTFPAISLDLLTFTTGGTARDLRETQRPQRELC